MVMDVQDQAGLVRCGQLLVQRQVQAGTTMSELQDSVGSAGNLEVSSAGFKEP